VQVKVNGEPREMPDHSTLTHLVAVLDLPAQRIAIELNRTVVRKANWPATELNEGDQIEVVHFVGGGASHLSSDAVRCRVALKSSRRVI